MRTLLLLLLLPFGRLAFPQDKILLMNGQILEGKVLGQSTLEICNHCF